MMAEKQKQAPVSAVKEAKEVRHRVLYVRAEPTAGWQPIASGVEGDENNAEDFAALRIEKLNEARRAGAHRPEFREQTELNGKPVEVN